MKQEKIEKCINILTETKKGIDDYMMWSDDLMNDRYQQLDSESKELSKIINLLTNLLK